MALNDSSNLARADDLIRLEALPTTIVDHHGLPMDVSREAWQFNVAGENFWFDFARSKIQNQWLSYALKRHLIFSLRRVSPRECYNLIRLNVLWMEKAHSWETLIATSKFEEHTELLDRVMSETLALLRSNGTDYNFHRLRAWYSWCTDFIPECGFDPDDAYKWERTQISGNEKGVAVRRSDPTEGPLNDAELIVLRRALQQDASMELEHIMQRSAIWLALVFGRNPANYCQLRLVDFHAATEDEDDDLWALEIPRIKKRAKPRSLFKTEYVAPALAKVIRDQIAAAGRVVALWGDDAPDAMQRPMFPLNEPRQHQLGSSLHEWAWHRGATSFTQLIRAAVKRYGLISPRTNEPLYVTTRRLRYTFATNRVREGISARDLAEALDHSDLQHVRVYFDARSSVVERLDAAGAKAIAPKLKLFQGERVKSGVEGKKAGDSRKYIRIVPELLSSDHHLRDLGKCGKEEFCNLYPPYSCYPCHLFKPFEDSLEEHEMVFDLLIERRERLRADPLGSGRFAVQLDEVIYACAEVIVEIQGLEVAHVG
jgi:integrase